MFLDPDEIAKLTGIRKGSSGKSRETLQCSQLRLMGIPFFVNAKGEPIVARAAFQMSSTAPPPPPPKAWQPGCLN
jgi:hypothetical protein